MLFFLSCDALLDADGALVLETVPLHTGPVPAQFTVEEIVRGRLFREPGRRTVAGAVGPPAARVLPPRREPHVLRVPAARGVGAYIF